MKFLTNEVKIAIVAIVGVVILFFGMNFLKGLNVFSSADDYYIEFKDISGLSASSPIYADGYQIGTVKSVIYDYSNESPIRVLAAIDKQMRVPMGTTAEIESDMLGNVKINLLLANNPRQRIEPGGVISGDQSNGAMGQLTAMIPQVEKLLPKLDSILASLNTLLADPALQSSLHNVETITSNLTVSTQELNTLMKDLNTNVPTLMAKADKVLDNTDKLTGNLAAIDLQETMNEVNSTISNVQSLTAKLNSNEGTIGLLMNDPALYNNLNSTMRSADSLLINFREHPKRYVHFSLFGKKEK